MMVDFMDGVLPIKDKAKNQRTIIKVIGVGGGGGNAVNYMYRQNVENVSYLLCNTDQQHLDACDVPHTICLGEKTTKGLGAGNNPRLAHDAAEESEEKVREALSDGTEMVFITAGMGGGTGTGAAPVIARIAKSMGILTVGIVTIPFLFEGRSKILQAIDGVEELKKNVDAILVVNNELLNKIYPDLKMTEGFRKADETLTTSTRSISEMITIPGIVNLDFNDVKTTLESGGVSIITRGFASEEEGLKKAMQEALDSPLLNTSNFSQATRLLIQVTYKPDHEPTTKMAEELKDMTAKVTTKFDFIWGMSERDDETMENDLGFILLASGFDDSVMIADEYQDEIPRRSKEEEEKTIGNYYGSDLSQANTYKEYETVIFTDELLVNNGFISLVNQRPTLTRSKEQLETIRQFIEGDNGFGNWSPQCVVSYPKESKPVNRFNSGASTGGLIKFGDD
ncbi:MAG: cell division protein FtsZ [Bacteroidales bacterium]|uniref:cell division protein FtsZ n=1 Tax=Porphyromonas sp. TaxID=1924944 RepID=UPI002979BCB0|nr:cell division protein FtsZ [Porphyromonas sp.]MDD7438572.1 cell division protein FtsZ [Bacteroidales bacterium]MDY3067987.1 cell division protein FtsZ [Porphyromonas sp.]